MYNIHILYIIHIYIYIIYIYINNILYYNIMDIIYTSISSHPCFDL